MINDAGFPPEKLLGTLASSESGPTVRFSRRQIFPKQSWNECGMSWIYMFFYIFFLSLLKIIHSDIQG